MQPLVEYSSGEGSESAEEDTQANTSESRLPSHDSAVVAPRGLKRCFEHVEGQWATTVMILGTC
jgi:hypothetical protein